MPSTPTIIEPDLETAVGGKVFVFSGKFAALSRREAAALVRRHGGQTRHHVTRRTSYLVVGDVETRRSNRKVNDAERLARLGTEMLIIDETEFLALLGLQSASRLRDRYYSGRDVQRMYQLESKVLRQLEKMAVVSPILKTNSERYYTFSDLLVFRQVHAAVERGASLAGVARRLLQARTGQMGIRFDGESGSSSSAEVIPLDHTGVTSYSAEDWYNLGCEHDEDSTGVERAIEAYRHALDLDPYHVGALINQGNLLYDLGNIEEARGLYERALASDPDNAVAHFNLGNVHDDLGEYQRAIRYFREAIRLRPDNADAHFNLGLVYDRIGQVERVREHMHQYLRLSPQGDMADIAREYLQITAEPEDEPQPVF